ncbi:MAG: tetratricopeptide repeat protein [Bacteroidetes bacterium]|nr:tetratricopeptide repeat protein [Bacteroidota bacterium]
MTFRQKLVILLAVVLAVLIYFAPKLPSEKQQEAKESSSDYAPLIAEAKKNLTSEQRSAVDKLESQASNEEAENKKVVLYDSIRKVWLNYKNPYMYAVYGQSVAEIENTEQAWLNTGDAFMKAGKISNDSNKPTMYKSAIKSYEKALAINPSNVSAKVKLGTCYVESASLLGTQPMTGITLLREVLQKDSNNIEANLQLGLFSVTSQQYDKAIARFQRILRIDSSHIDMYVYLGDTYLSMGKRKQAIENYENYKERVKDTLITRNIDEYIKKLKNQP